MEQERETTISPSPLRRQGPIALSINAIRKRGMVSPCLRRGDGMPPQPSSNALSFARS